MRYILIICLQLAFTLGLLAQEVRINCNAPREAGPGTYFPVEITISKYDMRCYATFEQKLPRGYKVRSIDVGTADTSFVDGVKFSWLMLPKEEDVRISYYIFVPSTAKDTLVLGGDFSFQFNNGLGKVSMKPEKVAIKKGLKQKTTANTDKKDDKVVVNEPKDNKKVAKDTTTKVTKDKKTVNLYVTCKRKRVIDDEKKNCTVTLTINKADNNGNISITERIPNGYKIERFQNVGAKYYMYKNEMRISWDKKPTSKELTISYTILPPKEKSAFFDPQISGEIFFYATKATLESNLISDGGSETINLKPVYKNKDVDDIFSDPDTTKNRIMR